MVSARLSYFQLLICLVLCCTLISIGHARSTFVDDDEDRNPLETSFVNDFVALHGKNPLEDFDSNKKSFHPADVQLMKRIIMLPRVGRRSV